MTNVDKQEVNKFSDIADEWWNKNGDFKPLHVINPLRAKYIKDKTDLENKKVLDVGCGGGLLAEALHDFGAKVTGIDAAGPGIEVAKLHASNNHLSNWLAARGEFKLASKFRLIKKETIKKKGQYTQNRSY